MTESAVELSKAFMEAAGRTTTLYNLTGVYAELLGRLDDADLDLADAEKFQAMADAIEGAIEEKAEAYACVITELEYRAAAQRAEAKRLTDRAASRERKAEWLTAYLKSQMDAVGCRRIESVRYTIAIRLNNPSVVVLEEAMVPSQFNRVIPAKIEVDKRAILAYVKEGGAIPAGVDVVRTERLELK